MRSGGPSITLYQIFPFGGNRAENFIVQDLHKGQPGSSWNGDISQIKKKKFSDRRLYFSPGNCFSFFRKWRLLSMEEQCCQNDGGIRRKLYFNTMGKLWFDEKKVHIMQRMKSTFQSGVKDFFFTTDKMAENLIFSCMVQPKQAPDVVWLESSLSGK